jgi:predicted amidohydrolase YtcJ
MMHVPGIRVNCHANGEVAIDMFLRAVERAQKVFSKAPEVHAMPHLISSAA